MGLWLIRNACVGSFPKNCEVRFSKPAAPTGVSPLDNSASGFLKAVGSSGYTRLFWCSVPCVAFKSET